MNIVIKIECETIQDFHSHLLSIFESSIALTVRKGISIEQGEGSFDPSEDAYELKDINDGSLNDDNCYGSHEIELLEDEDNSFAASPSSDAPAT